MQFHRSFLFIEGIIFLLLGLLALSQPYLATLGIELMLGVFLIAAGIIQGYRALKYPMKFLGLTAAAFSLILGILFLIYPVTGILTLTLLIMAFFVIDGISKVIGGFQFRPTRGWGWLTLCGMLSLLLAFLIFKGGPTTAAWLIGFYLGIYWIFLGTSLLTLFYYLKRV